MTKTERDDLIRYIDNVAGPVPSEISNALAALEPFVNQPPARAQWEVILRANLKLGTSPGEETTKPGVILSLRQKVMALSVDPEAPPELPPVTPPPQSGPGPVDPVPNDGVRRNFGPMFQNTTYTTHAGGDGSFSFSTASGNAWHKMWVNDVLVIDGGMTPIGVKAGDKIDMQITTQTQGNATYSLNKYG